MRSHKKIKSDLNLKGVESSMKSRRVLMQSHGIRKAFDGNKVLKDVSFDLKEGEVVLLRGDNGSGKTTLLNILTGNMEPNKGVINLDIEGTTETFVFPRQWWQNLNPFDHFTPERVAKEAVGRTWQGVRLFPSQSLLDNIAVATPSQPGESLGRSILFRRYIQNFENNNRKKSSELLSSLGLEDRVNSSADKISLGQTKRVAIARAIRAGARILFLDEPFSGLDEKGVEEITFLLTDLARNDKVTLVIIEHVFNIRHVLNLAHTVWTLRDGSITVETPDKVYLEMKDFMGDGVVALLKSIAGIDATAIEQKLPSGAKLTRFQNSKINNQEQKITLEIKDLVVRRGSRLVIGEESPDGTITGLGFTIHSGDLAVLQAPNGWGKTTLLEAIAGVLPIERGEIFIEGKLVNGLPTWERIRLGLSVLQARNHHFDNLTGNEFFRLTSNLKMPDEVGPYASRKLSSLSDGECQKLVLKGNNNQDFRVRVLDEPFLSLDADSLNEISTFLSAEANKSSLVLTPSLYDSTFNSQKKGQE